jgi:hypothetical protein
LLSPAIACFPAFASVSSVAGVPAVTSIPTVANISTVVVVPYLLASVSCLQPCCCFCLSFGVLHADIDVLADVCVSVVSAFPIVPETAFAPAVAGALLLQALLV